MQTSKSSYYNVEAFHNTGNLVIQFMPEYMNQIEDRLVEAGFTGTPVTEVECLKFAPESNKYIKMTMQRIEIEYSNQAVDWFLSQDWKLK